MKHILFSEKDLISIDDYLQEAINKYSVLDLYIQLAEKNPKLNKTREEFNDYVVKIQKIIKYYKDVMKQYENA